MFSLCSSVVPLWTGYHQKCHEPVIPSDVVKVVEAPWVCFYCRERYVNPHVEVKGDPFHASDAEEVITVGLPKQKPRMVKSVFALYNFPVISLKFVLV